MRYIYVDRMDDGRISVRVAAGIGRAKTKLFKDRDKAIRCAESNMGGKGMVVDTTLMPPERLAAHKACEARVATAIDKITSETKD